MITFELNENAFYAQQSVTFNPDLLSKFEEGPRFSTNAGRYQRSDGFNFGIVNRERYSALTHDSNHAWCYKDWQALLGVELAEYVTRKQRSIHLSQSSIPSFLGTVDWK
jgi:hypothetical protein